MIPGGVGSQLETDGDGRWEKALVSWCKGRFRLEELTL